MAISHASLLDRYSYGLYSYGHLTCISARQEAKERPAASDGTTRLKSVLFEYNDPASLMLPTSFCSNDLAADSANGKGFSFSLPPGHSAYSTVDVESYVADRTKTRHVSTISESETAEASTITGQPHWAEASTITGQPHWAVEYELRDNVQRHTEDPPNETGRTPAPQPPLLPLLESGHRPNLYTGWDGD